MAEPVWRRSERCSNCTAASVGGTEFGDSLSSRLAAGIPNIFSPCVQLQTIHETRYSTGQQLAFIHKRHFHTQTDAFRGWEYGAPSFSSTFCIAVSNQVAQQVVVCSCMGSDAMQRGLLLTNRNLCHGKPVVSKTVIYFWAHARGIELVEAQQCAMGLIR